MDERRRFERRETMIPAEVCDEASREVIGLLADISSGGMMLRTDAPLACGRHMRLRVELPDDSAGPRELVVEASVRWCEPDLDPPAHVAGLEFQGATPPRTAMIEEIRRRLSQVR